MIPKYTQEEFDKSMSKALLQLECKCCSNIFYRTKTRIKIFLDDKYQDTGDYCSIKCSTSFRPKQQVVCKTCNKLFFKKPNQIARSINNFCSNSCKVTHQNANKISGFTRSKLEQWIENKLITLYPNVNILFNDRLTLGKELDIYIPDLKLAFELNGLFHYEPIFGIYTLNRMQNNDLSKSKLCIEKQIDLCIINTSGQKSFRESTSQVYLDIITSIIDGRFAPY